MWTDRGPRTLAADPFLLTHGIRVRFETWKYVVGFHFGVFCFAFFFLFKSKKQKRKKEYYGLEILRLVTDVHWRASVWCGGKHHWKFRSRARQFPSYAAATGDVFNSIRDFSLSLFFVFCLSVFHLYSHTTFNSAILILCSFSSTLPRCFRYLHAESCK